MDFVRAKKNLGQHFLTDQDVARDIVTSLVANRTNHVLEIGPGMGVLTQYLLEREGIDLKVVEIDQESVRFLLRNFPALKEKILKADFLKVDLSGIFKESFSIIGNFPYNISSQIFFKVLNNKNQVPEVVCMLQKEVAERICAKEGSRTYGILSVLLQTFYNIEYLFTVEPEVFSPPPKVRSAVIRLERNDVRELECNEALFFKVVKTAFNQRRKMLRNSMKQLFGEIPEEFQMLRPEQLSPEQFLFLAKQLEEPLAHEGSTPGGF
jgi:16S rRNA (adenine1518-N6/adenine1519-N6)-dimethyltransferase